MEVVKAIDALKQEDKRQLFKIILNPQAPEQHDGVEMPWSITEDWWGLGPIDHAMDRVIDRKDAVDFYDECVFSSGNDCYYLDIGFTCAGEGFYEPGEPGDFESEEEYEETMAEFEENMTYGTLNITLDTDGRLVDYDWYID